MAIREATPAGVRALQNTSVRERILALRCWRDARTVGLFAAIRGEVDLLPLVELALSIGKRAVFPRADRSGGTLTFHAVASAGDLLSGAFGVPEPPADPARFTPLHEIDLLLVPGVAFDARGGRLGFGGGFYDRLLSSVPPSAGSRPLAVGLAFECQVVPKVPTEPSDRRVDALVTEARSLWCDRYGNRDRVL